MDGNSPSNIRYTLRALEKVSTFGTPLPLRNKTGKVM